MNNKIKESFAAVKASPRLKADTLQYVLAQREKRAPKRPAWAAAAAALCAVVLAVSVLYRLAVAPVAYVSVDVNPSIELSLNRFDRVVSARAYNPEGEAILHGVSLTGKLYTTALDLLLDSDAMQPYLTDTAALTFTVAADGEEKETALLTGIENSAGCQKHGGESCKADASTLEEAHSYGLSFGKYAAYQTLAEHDETVTPEDCHHMSMSEIRQRISACQHDGEGHHYGWQQNSSQTAPIEDSVSSSPPIEDSVSSSPPVEDSVSSCSPNGEENCSSGAGQGNGGHHGQGNGNGQVNGNGHKNGHHGE